MAAEQCAVVGDTWCTARLHKVIEPERVLPSTKFLMHINTTIRRLKQHHGDYTSFEFDDEQEEDMIDLLLEEENWSTDEKDVTIELDCNDPHDVNVGEMSQALSHLQVPLQAQESLVDTMLYRSFESARNCGSCADGKILHMEIDIDLYVV